MPPHSLTLRDEHALDRAEETLRAGGVIVFPTDTLPGFSTRISDRAGQDRIRALKQVDADRPFVMLAASAEMVSRYVDSFGSAGAGELDALWPAPLTAVLPAGGNCPPWVGDTVAFRVPDYVPVIELVSRLEEPIVSTSVNLTGTDPLVDVVGIEGEFGGRVDLIVLAESGGRGAPSTIVDFTGASPRLVRGGAFGWPR